MLAARHDDDDNISFIIHIYIKHTLYKCILFIHIHGEFNKFPDFFLSKHLKLSWTLENSVCYCYTSLVTVCYCYTSLMTDQFL